jgi:hypothetical protein
MTARRSQTRLILVCAALLVALAVLWFEVGRRAPNRSTAAAIAEPAEAIVELTLDDNSNQRALAMPLEAESRAIDDDVALQPDAPSPTPASDDVVLDGVMGEVRDVLGFPLAGARVSLRAQVADRGAELATAVTNSAGRYKIPLTNWRSPLEVQRRIHERRERSRDDVALGAQMLALGIDERPTFFPATIESARRRPELRRNTRGGGGPLTLVVSASCTGYEPFAERREVSGAMPTYLEVNFSLAPGLAKHGFVKPHKETFEGLEFGIPGAQVYLLDDRGVVVKRARSFDGGAYSMFIAEAGRYSLFARHAAFGTAYVDDFELDPANATRLPDLSMGGGSVLAGRVTYPDGNAVEMFGVQARHESLAQREIGGVTEAERIALERDGGLVIADSMTDAWGSFMLHGVHGGDHDLHFPEENDPALQPNRRSTAGDTSVHLIYRGYRLRVWVQQQRASAADAPQIECRKLTLDDDGNSVEALVGSWNGQGQWFTTVRPGERYLVRAWASNMQADWTIVDISPASYETIASLFLLGNLSSAEVASDNPWIETLASKIELDVRDEQGGVVKGWSARAVAPDGTIPRGWSKAKPDESGALPPLPPGTYALTVTDDSPGSYTRFDAGALPVVAKSGQTSKVQARASIGGRVRLVTRAVENSSGQTKGSFTRAGLSEVGVRARYVSAISSRDRPAALRLRVEADNKKNTDGEWLEIGASATGETLLEPGRYTIELEAPDGVERTCEVTVERGRTVDAVFEVAKP